MAERLPLQVIADDYASHGLGVFPALPRSKKPAGRWKPFQWSAPTDSQRDALFSLDYGLNIGVICGAASNNLVSLDCETPRAFEANLRRVDDAGYSDTWIVETQRGGHIHLLLRFPVHSIKKKDDLEVRAQGQFILLPPSQHPDGPLYDFLNRPANIAVVQSLDHLDWLQLEEVSNSQLKIPRKGLRLLLGEGVRNYASRSEAEQAIVTVLVNAAFTFDQILHLFRSYPAASKFSDLERYESIERGIEWLRCSFNKARDFCIQESPQRTRARQTLTEALNSPWPGRTGSTDKAVFCAHATLALRSGKQTYQASSRELAEISSCQRATATIATNRLRKKGLVELISPWNLLFANRYRLMNVDSKVSEIEPLTTQQCEGVAQTSSFVIPDAFRSGGLGKAAYEVFTALQSGIRTVPALSDRTGRHRQTVRKALSKMLPLGLVNKSGRHWTACKVDDLEHIAELVGNSGALKRQREKHQRDRIRRNVSNALLRQRQDEGIM